MSKWIYATNNAYDLIGKIVDDKVYIFTQDAGFPDLSGLDENERDSAIEDFMTDVMENDYHCEWDSYPLEELEGDDILWEKEAEDTYDLVLGDIDKGVRSDYVAGSYKTLEEAKTAAKRFLDWKYVAIRNGNDYQNELTVSSFDQETGEIVWE